MPPVAQKNLSAVLLAGGRSIRMGRDKALLELDGEQMWQRQQRILRDFRPAELFLSVRPEQAWTRSARGFDAVLLDALAGGGPLVGLTAALERMSPPALAVLAIDLPAMTTEWFERLYSGLEDDRGVVGRHEGYFEPLAAIYPRAVLPLAWDALVRGEYSLQALLRRAIEGGLMRVHAITSAESVLFRNWNEPVAHR